MINYINMDVNISFSEGRGRASETLQGCVTNNRLPDTYQVNNCHITPLSNKNNF
jgi:hypothetical protein